MIADIANYISTHSAQLGTLLFEGLRTINTPKILWGSVLSALLAVSINRLLKMVEERL
jgi:osmoprotectant transport system permease protein